MNFPPIVWPSFIKFIRNWMFATFIIKPYFDNEFSLPDFIEASKQAVQVVSGALQRSDFNTLEGLVKQEALVVLKNAVSNLSMAQREMLSIDVEDIYYAFPYQVGVMFDESDKRWVEITMCYHVLKGLKSMTEAGDLPPLSLGVQPEYQDKLYILNYRFIREFTKGVEDSWWVNVVNHFQPRTLIQTPYQENGYATSLAAISRIKYGLEVDLAFLTRKKCCKRSQMTQVFPFVELKKEREYPKAQHIVFYKEPKYICFMYSEFKVLKFGEIV
ncbi:m-AAA protease-interacting protein 1, mitochondrial [Eumeta japonica]|uniref:M-AAA protease-interacting protein 1, mitochondrial n=1 Tax=Eumeta variegata TaxID=151549 RepID=A0A4C1VS32_EUMVA|nr:m-AAA protease-interacting protein 1, mitochondrial [Eumeta japonica]